MADSLANGSEEAGDRLRCCCRQDKWSAVSRKCSVMRMAVRVTETLIVLHNSTRRLA